MESFVESMFSLYNRKTVCAWVYVMALIPLICYNFPYSCLSFLIHWLLKDRICAFPLSVNSLNICLVNKYIHFGQTD